MKVKIQRLGNFDGIIIPRDILKQLNLKQNDKLDLKFEDDKLIFTKIKNGNISLEDKFAKYEGENLTKDFDWDEDIGKEVW